MRNPHRIGIAAAILAAMLLCAQKKETPPDRPSESELAALRSALEELAAQLRPLARDPLYADVAIYQKAADWILRHPEEFYRKAYYENARKVIARGLERAAERKAGSASWTKASGAMVARAYISRVDGSLQPYSVWVPDPLPPAPLRLDVILHGRNATLNEVSFRIAAESAKAPAHNDRIELHVFGRTNNAYRWAGETDVLEAIAEVKRRYRIDEDRIVLRGFSMGGAGAWHLGFHYPHLWAGIEAGAGFSETLHYAKLDAAPEHERRAWTIYDSYLYARNATLVPTVGYGSLDDPQLQASLNVKEQLAAEENVRAAPVLFLVGPAIGHQFAPESKRESEAFLASHLPRKQPDSFRFVTYTARYGRYRWLLIDGLERHYERAEVEADRKGDRAVLTTRNVTRLLFDGPLRVTIDGQAIHAPVRALERVEGRWRAAAELPKGLRKRHGLQGPIDDAFLEAFLCVKGSGPEPPRLTQFRATWDKFLRGALRVVTDTTVTPDQIRSHHLILFGDARTNRLLARILPKLPLRWEATGVTIGGRRFEGAGLTPSLIYPNPLQPGRYVVINSGHTFGEREFRGTNALLYPRLGDWAVHDANGELRGAGFFDEFWRGTGLY